MLITNDAIIKGILEIESLPTASLSNFSLLFENNGMVSKRTVGDIIHSNTSDFLGGISNSFPSIFDYNVSTIPSNPNLVVSLKNQLAGTVFAAPTTLNGTPGFRKLQDSDFNQTTVAFESDLEAYVPIDGDTTINDTKSFNKPIIGNGKATSIDIAEFGNVRNIPHSINGLSGASAWYSGTYIFKITYIRDFTSSVFSFDIRISGNIYGAFTDVRITKYGATTSSTYKRVSYISGDTDLYNALDFQFDYDSNTGEESIYITTNDIGYPSIRPLSMQPGGSDPKSVADSYTIEIVSEIPSGTPSFPAGLKLPPPFAASSDLDNYIPYEGADQPIDFNTQDVTMQGLLNVKSDDVSQLTTLRRAYLYGETNLVIEIEPHPTWTGGWKNLMLELTFGGRGSNSFGNIGKVIISGYAYDDNVDPLKSIYNGTDLDLTYRTGTSTSGKSCLVISGDFGGNISNHTIAKLDKVSNVGNSTDFVSNITLNKVDDVSGYSLSGNLAITEKVGNTLKGWQDLITTATAPTDYDSKFSAMGRKHRSYFGITAGIGTWLNVFGYKGGESSKAIEIINGSTGAIGYRYEINDTTWSDFFEFYHEGNFNPAQYVLQSSLNTQLANYVPINGSTTINDTKTFSSAPIVPNGTLAGHAVNFGQLNTAVADGNTAFNWGNHANVGYLVASDLNGYATESWVTNQGYSTQTLTEGSNITISGNVISATNTTYSGGSVSLLTTGTNTTSRVWRADHLHSGILQLIEENAEGVFGISNQNGIYTKDWNSNALSDKSLAIGFSTNSTAPYAASVGSALFTGGFGSNNFGYSSTVNGSLSVNLGAYNNSQDSYDTTVGIGLQARGAYQTVFGTYNTPYGSDIGAPASKDTRMIFGIGLDDTDRKTAFRVMADGSILYEIGRDDSDWQEETVPDIRYIRNNIVLSTSFVDIPGSGTQYVSNDDVRNFAEVHLRITGYSTVTVRLNSSSNLLTKGQKLIIYNQYDDQVTNTFHPGTGRTIETKLGNQPTIAIDIANVFTFVVVDSNTLRLIGRTNIA